MPRSFRHLLLLGALLVVQGAHAYVDDEDDDDEDKPTHARVETIDTPKARYQARMDMLNARVEMQRKWCKATSHGAMDYCTKEVDQNEREQRYKIEQSYKDELAKEGKQN